MDNKTLRKLERHCTRAADIIIIELVTSAPHALADHARGVDVSLEALDTLASLAEAGSLLNIAGAAHGVRKAVV